MLGTERRVRTMYGDAIDDEMLNKGSGPGVLAFVALLLAIVALVLVLGKYMEDDSARMKKVAADIVAAQSGLKTLEARIQGLENRPDKGQELALNAIVTEIAGKAEFLATQPLTDGQREALRKALESLATQ